VEVTLRTPAALDAIVAMRAAAPGLAVGAGTLLTPADVDAAVAAGADFLVSPGTTPALAQAFLASGLPSLPGVATASEAIARRAEGFAELKFFPAEAIGGTALLKSWLGPLPDLAFCPTGGISPAKATDYLALANVACIGGSWIASEASMDAQDWAGIEARAAAAAGL
jgi:2-dehydro-3-deoxyphosphogluconate aldolase/(4S)-4-hydroxy-2-oxoglutarate aldolase